VKPPVTVTVCESGLVTTTSTTPAEWAAVVAVRLVALPKTTVAARPEGDGGQRDEVGAGDGHHGAAGGRTGDGTEGGHGRRGRAADVG